MRVNLFFCNDTATTEIYTLSLHDALPIWALHNHALEARVRRTAGGVARHRLVYKAVCVPRLRAVVERAQVDEVNRSEEHTSELQSRQYLVCRLLLEKTSPG